MKFFHGSLELEIPQGVYFPMEDSMLLAAAVPRISGKKVLEIGCGSGIISMVMAKSNSVTAADVNPAAAAAAKRNATANGLEINVVVSDLFSGIRGSFDCIIFNPPYLPAEEDDMTYSGGADGREVIKKFAAGCREHLRCPPRQLRRGGHD